MRYLKPASAIALLIALAALPLFARDETSRTPARYLIIAVDGVGFDIAEEMHKKGELKNFLPPRPLINAFPSTTNPGLIEILQPLGAPVARGYEDVYFDPFSNKMRGSLFDRFSRKHFIETTFRDIFDYHPHRVRMTVEYAIPVLGPWVNARFSMARLKKKFLESEKPVFYAYVASSDLAIHLNGKWLLRNLLKRLDEMAGEIRRESKRPVEIIVHSDHGNLVGKWKRAKLEKTLKKAGFKLHRRIKNKRSVVMPKFGLISSAHLQTARGREAAVAEALASAEGVDFSVFRRGGKLHILGPRGKATVERRRVNNVVFFRYSATEGDPLELNPIAGRLAAEAARDREGFFDESDWLRATAEHTYPDPLRRLWQGFGWVEQPVSVLVSLEDGYYTGSLLLDIFAFLRATHGNLRRSQSLGVLLSTDSRLFESDLRPFTGGNLMGRIGQLHAVGCETTASQRLLENCGSAAEDRERETCAACL